MNRREHLLTIFAEECAEVAQRASKSKRFGDSEIQPGQLFTNGERVNVEYIELLALHDMLVAEGICPPLPPEAGLLSAKERKRARVEEYLAYAAECGTLAPAPPAKGAHSTPT